MRFKKFEELELKKVEAAAVKGGTTTTEYTQTGYAEMEQELDENGNKIGKPVLVEFPNG